MDIAHALLKCCDKDTKPLDVIKKGVELLDRNKVYDNKTKRYILIEIIKMYAVGEDGQGGTADDRLSPETVSILTMLIESEMIGLVIDGIVAGIRKIKLGCFKRCFR
jgi:hypothetical protein